MSIKDVNRYYSQVHNQYVELLKDLQEYDSAYKDGIIPQESYNAQISFIERLKENYERLSYIMLLLNQPNKPLKVVKYKKQNKELFSKLNNSSDKKIIEENSHVLSVLRKNLQKQEKACVNCKNHCDNIFCVTCHNYSEWELS